MMTLLTHTLLLYQLPNNCYLQLTGLPVSVSHYDPARTLAHRHVTPVLRRALGLPSRRRLREPVADTPSRALEDPSRVPDEPARVVEVQSRACKSKPRKHVRHKRHKARAKEAADGSVARDVTARPAPSVTAAPAKSRDQPRKRLGTRFVLPSRANQRTEARDVPEPVPVPVPEPPAPPPPAPRKSSTRAPTPGTTRSVKRAWVSLDHHAILYSNIHTRCRGLPLSHVLNSVEADLAGATLLARNIFDIPGARNLPSRVNNLLPLLTELIGAHKRCNYSALLEHHCPILPRSRAPTNHVINPRKRARDEDESEPRESKRARVTSGTSLLPPTPRQIKVHARLMQSPSPYVESFDLTQRTGTVVSTPQLSPRPSLPNFNLRLLLSSPGKSPLRRTSPVKLSPVKHVSQEGDSSHTPHKLYITQDFTPSLSNTPLKTPLSAPLITQTSDILNSGISPTGTAHVTNTSRAMEEHSSPATPITRGTSQRTAEQLPPPSSHGTAKTRVKLSQVELSELLTYYSTDYQITSFLISVLQHVVPVAVWGSNHNARLMFNCKSRCYFLPSR
jgi:hypothetical protein